MGAGLVGSQFLTNKLKLFNVTKTCKGAVCICLIIDDVTVQRLAISKINFQSGF